MECNHPQNLPTQADLILSPDDSLNSYKFSVEVGVTYIEAYGRGYVTINVQQFKFPEHLQSL
jgi:hypothetical protein